MTQDFEVIVPFRVSFRGALQPGASVIAQSDYCASSVRLIEEYLLHAAGGMERPDFDRIAALIARIDELCREAQQLREHIASLTATTTYWPDPADVASRLTEIAKRPESGGQVDVEADLPGPSDLKPEFT